MKTYWSAVFLGSLFISGCGGGGGSTPTPQPQYFSTGNPSTQAAATTALLTDPAMSLPYDSPDGFTFSTFGQAHASLNSGNNPIATTDTNAATAWADGWTGKGVDVGILDSFNSNGRVDSHGDYVTTVVLSVAPEADAALANISTNSGRLSLVYAVNASKQLEAQGVQLFNGSWGIQRSPTYNYGFDYDVNYLVSNYDPNDPSELTGLYVWAAGNNAVDCLALEGSRRIEDCNLFAAYAAGVMDLYDLDLGSDMFVGALSDGTNNLASYSLQAGDLKNHFIVAHDDVLTAGDAAGTSFAAPRVTGAAALVMHKFPNLSPLQVKQVLLETATDLGATGVDDVFGYGKLNIPGALSPQGTVTPK